MFLVDTAGNMPLERVLTHGDAMLVTVNGSIIDGGRRRLGTTTSDVARTSFANNIWLDANGGSIGDAASTGRVGNDVEDRLATRTLGDGTVGLEAVGRAST